MNTVFLGSRAFVFPVIDILAKHSTLTAVLTKPDAPAGRGEKITPSPVKEYTQRNFPEIPVFTPDKLDEATYEILSNHKPDLFIVAAYGLLIPKRFLDLPTKMTINIHPSLLPHLRGASPLQSAILEGNPITGVTIMKLDEQLDHGPIIWQKEVAMSPDETFLTLGEKTFRTAVEHFPTLLSEIENDSAPLHEQDHEKATFCQQITREDGYIDIQNPPPLEMIDRMIRAYDPWPNVWGKITLKNQEVRIKFYPQNSIQVEGKKKMPVKEFLNGYPEMRETLRKILTF